MIRFHSGTTHTNRQRTSHQKQLGRKEKKKTFDKRHDAGSNCFRLHLYFVMCKNKKAGWSSHSSTFCCTGVTAKQNQQSTAEMGGEIEEKGSMRVCMCVCVCVCVCVCACVHVCVRDGRPGGVVLNKVLFPLWTRVHCDLVSSQQDKNLNGDGETC